MKRTWFPDADQVVVVPRDYTTYTHSLWVGFTAPVLNLPILVFNHMVVPLFKGGVFVLTGTAMSLIAGIVGLAAGLVEMTPEEVEDFRCAQRDKV